MPAFEIEELENCIVCGGGSIEVIDSATCLSRCESCGYVFDNPRPTLDALVNFYSAPAKYDSWLQEEDGRNKLWTRRLKKLRRTARKGSLLDVGAGIGQFLNLARHDFNEVRGTEVSSSAVAIAQAKYGLRLLHGTIDSVPLPPASFDNITVFHVLEHVPNPRAMVEKCHSLLRSDGVLVIAVPNDYQPMKSRLRLMLGRLGVAKFRRAAKFGLEKIRLDGSMGEIHLSHFAPKVLLHLVESCGFRVIDEGIDPYYVPVPGLKGVRQDTRYLAGRAVYALSHVNVYDAIWMVAQKRE